MHARPQDMENCLRIPCCLWRRINVFPSVPDVTPVCGPYEEFKECGTACERTCAQNRIDSGLIGPCILLCIPNVCQCRTGYARSAHNACIPVNACPDAPSEYKLGCIVFRDPDWMSFDLFLPPHPHMNGKWGIRWEVGINLKARRRQKEIKLGCIWLEAFQQTLTPLQITRKARSFNSVRVKRQLTTCAEWLDRLTASQ